MRIILTTSVQEPPPLPSLLLPSLLPFHLYSKKSKIQNFLIQAKLLKSIVKLHLLAKSAFQFIFVEDCYVFQIELALQVKTWTEIEYLQSQRCQI